MFKNKLFLFAVAVILFNCSNASFATSTEAKGNVYPNYSSEFCGKDTCEKFNRKLFTFNLKLNKYIIRPVNIVWASVLPAYGMERLKNAYNNMNYPERVVSCLLQKDFKTAKTESIRFITNTTIGLGGLYDPAKNKFKIKPCHENMEQALAHFEKIKPGPYLVLPVVRGNVRDLVGQLFDAALHPTSYIGGFGSAISAVLNLNNSTYAQPAIKKMESSFADPYILAKKMDGIEGYINNANLDREDVFTKNVAAQNIIKVSDLSCGVNVKADVEMPDYNQQCPVTDSLRTCFFANQKIYHSIWNNMSVWNRNFDKKLKTTSININPDRTNYRYRYILQKTPSSPIAIIYPSIGETVLAESSVVMANILYNEGYSVVVQGSSFEYNFVKSMPKGYVPGLPEQDARLLSLTTSKILDSLEQKNGQKFDKKVIVGTSFGALTGLFVMAQDEQEKINGKKSLDISKCIAINPPIDIFYALKQVDKYSQECKNDSSDLKLRTAITVVKVKLLASDVNQKELDKMPATMPFTEAESKQIVSFIMEEKLYNVVFALENASRNKKNGVEEAVNNMSFSDYSKKYLNVSIKEDVSTINSDSSLYSIASFLKNSDKYKIYQTKDDYFVNQQQLEWLKQQSDKKTLIFNHGSHLGYTYRKEFISNFKKDLKLEGESSPKALPSGL